MLHSEPPHVTHVSDWELGLAAVLILVGVVLMALILPAFVWIRSRLARPSCHQAWSVWIPSWTACGQFAGRVPDSGISGLAPLVGGRRY